jgi:hypothetical protein
VFKIEENMKNYKNERRSGSAWSRLLKIEICNPCGWNSEEEYENLLITKDVFCNFAANSVLIPPDQKDRAEVKRVREILLG